MIDVKKTTGFIGATLNNIDLNQNIAEAQKHELERLLAQHHVLFFRNQYLSITRQKILTEIFGKLIRLPYISPTEDDELVIAVLKQAHETNTGVFGGDWHSDFSFLQNPPAGSILNAVDIPEVGGDTLWVNQAQAYRSLSKELREFLQNKKVVHVGKPYGVKYAPPEDVRANASIKMTRGDVEADRETLHPAIITSPDTGEKALFINPIYSTRFEGMSDQQSQPYLEEIYKHCTRPDFACRHQWRSGDLVIWNNRTTLHYATNDYEGMRRLLYRTTFSRDIPQ